MGIILLLVFLAYLVGAGIVIGITAKCAKSKKTVWLVALFFVLFRPISPRIWCFLF